MVKTFPGLKILYSSFNTIDFLDYNSRLSANNQNSKVSSQKIIREPQTCPYLPNINSKAWVVPLPKERQRAGRRITLGERVFPPFTVSWEYAPERAWQETGSLLPQLVSVPTGSECQHLAWVVWPKAILIIYNLCFWYKSNSYANKLCRSQISIALLYVFQLNAASIGGPGS